MQWVGRSFGFQTGYDLNTDLPYGFRVYWGARSILDEGRRVYKRSLRYKHGLTFLFDWPRPVWRQEAWRVNEPGTLKGFPVPRAGVPSSSWTGRDRWIAEWRWPHAIQWF